MSVNNLLEIVEDIKSGMSYAEETVQLNLVN